MRTELRSIFLLVMTVVLLIGTGMGYADGAEQSVALSPTVADQPPGSGFTLSAFYEVSDGDNMLTGLGVRFHFDSRNLQFMGYSNILQTGLISTGDQPGNDVLNLDDDPETDKYVSIGWVSFTNPPNWPGATLPLELAKLDFVVDEEALDGPTPVNVSFSRKAAGYTTSSTDATINVTTTSTGTITGTVAYTGSAEGTIRVGAYSDENLENLVAETEQEAPGDFEIGDVPPGTYYVGAYLDIDDDIPDRKPAGQAGSPATVASGEMVDVGTITLYHIAARIALEANPLHISSTTPSESTLTATIVDSRDYVVDTGPDSTLEVTFAVADNTYGNIKLGETNPVTSVNGMATIVIVSKVHDSGGDISCTAPAEGVQGQGDLVEGFVTVTTGPFSIVPEGPVVLLVSETKEFNVAGGIPPYSWSVTAGSLSQSTTQTEDEKTVFTAPESETTGITMTVTDDMGIESQAAIDAYEPVEIVDKPTTPVRVEAGDSSDIFKVSGGDGSYTWIARDSMTAIIDTHEGNAYTFPAPSDGPFAGPYTITVSDGNGYEDSFDIHVPLQFIPQSENIKGGGEFDLVLAGANSDAAIAHIDFFDERLNIVPEQEMSQYATFVPEVPIDFNSEALLTLTGADVSELKMFRLRATVAGDSDLNESNGLDAATTGWIRILPVVTYSGLVQETAGGSPIADAHLIFKLGGTIQGDPIQTGIDGTFSTADLELPSPTVTGAEYEVEVLADNYVSRTDLTTADWDMENGETITLLEADMSISGTVKSDEISLQGALVESEVNNEAIVAYADANGDYTLNLPEIHFSDDPNGTWNFETTNSETSEGCEPANEETGTVVLTQTGSNVTMVVVDDDGPAFTGTVTEGNYRVIRTYQEGEDTTNVETVTFTFSSSTEGSGEVAWSWTDGDESCAGTIDLLLWRGNGETITELFARASAPGFVAATQDILDDPHFMLNPLDSGGEVGTEGGILTSGDCVINIPAGALDGPAQIELDCDIDVGPDSVYTRHSVALVEINVIGASISEDTPIQATIPFDMALVNPGDFFGGMAIIYYADSADDLRNGMDVNSVPSEDIIHEDHFRGLASFWLRHGSVFGVGASDAGPTVTTGTATTVGKRVATLNGAVNPNGTSTTYHFEYGRDTGYGFSTEEMDAGSGTHEIFASADLTGLLKDTTYHFRLVAMNSTGTTYGADGTFKTKDDSDSSICFIQTAAFGWFLK